MAEAFDAVRRTTPRSAGPDPREVEALITRAKSHALGVDFLLRGAHDAVAVTFGVHAFVVDAARDHLQSGARPRSTPPPR